MECLSVRITSCRRFKRAEELIGNFDGFTNFSYMDFDGCCSRKHPFIDNEEFWLNLINGGQISNSSGVDVHQIIMEHSIQQKTLENPTSKMAGEYKSIFNPNSYFQVQKCNKSCLEHIHWRKRVVIQSHVSEDKRKHVLGHTQVWRKFEAQNPGTCQAFLIF